MKREPAFAVINADNEQIVAAHPETSSANDTSAVEMYANGKLMLTAPQGQALNGTGDGTQTDRDSSISDLVTNAVQAVGGVSPSLGPVETFMNEMIDISVPTYTTTIVHSSATATAHTSATANSNTCAVISANPPITLLDSVGAVVCVGYAASVGPQGVSNDCDKCFAGVYATMSTNGLNNALKKFMGVSVIEHFGIFSNCEAQIVLMNAGVAANAQLPPPLNQDFVRGINIFGVIKKPTSCMTLGIKDVLCELVKPFWPPRGFKLYSQITISDGRPYNVTQTDIGLKVENIPIKDATSIKKIDIKYGMVFPTVMAPEPTVSVTLKHVFLEND